MWIHASHKLETIHSGNSACLRCHMCTCHSAHKMIAECEKIDGRAKPADESQ